LADIFRKANASLILSPKTLLSFMIQSIVIYGANITKLYYIT
jgi:hypothetical protein